MNEKNRNEAAMKIRNEYLDREPDKLDELRALDNRVKRPAEIFAYLFGIIGSLVLGTGMCLAMKIIGNLMPLGVVVGCVGIVMVTVNVFLYNAMIRSRKKKYADRILALSDRLLAGKGE